MDISSSINLNLNFRDSISVTELNYLIKSILDFEPSLQEISVLGEVSNTRVTPKKGKAVIFYSNQFLHIDSMV